MWAAPEKKEESEEPSFPWETRWDDTPLEDLDYGDEDNEDGEEETEEE